YTHHTHTHTHTHTRRDTCTYTHRHVQTRIHTEIHTHRHMYIHTQTHTHHKMLQYFVVHSQIRVLHSRGSREHSTHSLLCIHCTQLLSSLTAPSANDRTGLSSKPAQQDSPGGHTCPHHNFHLPLASRRVEISSPVVRPD
ncbi:unnamed protein product, partial [Staurois parvus]